MERPLCETVPLNAHVSDFAAPDVCMVCTFLHFDERRTDALTCNAFSPCLTDIQAPQNEPAMHEFFSRHLISR